MSTSFVAPRVLRWLRGTALLGVAALALLLALPAQAVPMFARETGQPCSACHIGGFGPQLTPFGRQFKLDGYRLDVHKGWDTHLSAMAVESFTHTQQPQAAPPAPNYGLNNNTELEQASIFYGGKLADHWGMLGQFTYQQATGQWGWDNTDVRYAHNYMLGGKGGVFGVSINNNPTVSDVFQTAPAWMYPYFATDLVPGPPASPAIMGAFAQQVVGARPRTPCSIRTGTARPGFTARCPRTCCSGVPSTPDSMAASSAPRRTREWPTRATSARAISKWAGCFSTRARGRWAPTATAP